MGRTYEIQIISEQMDQLKSSLTNLAYDYVDASFDDMDLADEESCLAIEGILQQETLPVTIYFSDLKSRDKCLAELKGLPLNLDIKIKDYDDSIWQQAWEAEERSFATERFAVIVNGEETESREFEIKMSSMGAFGSGQHATTKAILQLLELESQGQGSLLDVGTGTGILAIAAEKLSYHVVATDIDDQAIESARYNRENNHCSFEIIHGELPKKLNNYNMIVSNILQPVINNFLPDFAKRLDDGGKLILAGFNEANQDKILEDAESLGFQLKSQHNERGWLAFCFQLRQDSE